MFVVETREEDSPKLWQHENSHRTGEETLRNETWNRRGDEKCLVQDGNHEVYVEA